MRTHTHTHTQCLVTASAMAASLCAAPLNRHPEGGLRVFKVVFLKVHAYFQDHVTVHKALWNCLSSGMCVDMAGTRP